MGLSKSKLVIVDGYSILFRAFFAPGPYLSTADGFPTGALLGFMNVMFMILDQEKPGAIYVAWDPPGGTFRHDSFADYKANRVEAGDDLKKQLPIARELVDAMGIASVEVPRFEADDMIGTLATVGVKEGYEVIIVTGDTDQLQLVGDGVKVRMVRRGFTETALYDEAAVLERYGIPPERVPDYKALVGDTSDNIPGVPGIGDKTATKLLQQFGTIENLLAHVDEVQPERIRQNLKAAGDQPIKSRELATIHCEAPFTGPIQLYAPTAETWGTVRSFFERLEFRSLMRRIPSEVDSPVPVESRATHDFAVECSIIESQADLDFALEEARKSGRAGIRTYCDSTQPGRARLEGVAFAARPGRAFYVRTGQAGQDGLFESEAGFSAPLEYLRGILADSAVDLAGHNAKFDEIVLERHGLQVRQFGFDTMIAAYLLSPGRNTYSLPILAEEVLSANLTGEEGFPPEQTAMREAAAVMAWEPALRERLATQELEGIMYRIELPLIPVLADMERVGVPLDQSWLHKLSTEMEQRSAELTAEIYEIAGEEFTIGSTQQLQKVLFEKLKLPAGKKIKTGYSTGADVLEALAAEHAICRKILDYREVSKLKSTYADALPKLVNPETGRLHTSLNQTVAATGRLSSSDPNLQNIPIRSEIGREIRKAFVAPPGQVLLSCDYSQIELRIFAHVTEDPEMMRAFTADEDIHSATAMKLFNVELENVLPEMRRLAKTTNFAVIYGQSDFGLASTLGIPNAEARAFIESYFQTFPGVRDYARKTMDFARQHGYVQTLLGRRRYLPEINSGNFNIRQAAERAAVNMPIQGTAADIMKLAMIDVYRLLKEKCWNCVLLLQVHDELVFGVDQDLLPTITPEIVRHMEEAHELNVRLRVDAKSGQNWAEMAPILK